jgi:hypothetical protein
MAAQYALPWRSGVLPEQGRKLCQQNGGGPHGKWTRPCAHG